MLQSERGLTYCVERFEPLKNSQEFEEISQKIYNAIDVTDIFRFLQNGKRVFDLEIKQNDRDSTIYNLR